MGLGAGARRAAHGEANETHASLATALVGRAAHFEFDLGGPELQHRLIRWKPAAAGSGDESTGSTFLLLVPLFSKTASRLRE
jgi:hypothetical protein